MRNKTLLAVLNAELPASAASNRKTSCLVNDSYKLMALQRIFTAYMNA